MNIYRQLFLPLRAHNMKAKTARLQAWPHKGRTIWLTGSWCIPIPQTRLLNSESLGIPAIPQSFTIDPRSILVDLSDQYVIAARSIAGTISGSRYGDRQLQTYHKMMATGLGCLEAALLNSQWRQSPREHALLQLHYATLLFEETNNVSEIESVLSQGIAQCDRTRLHALKYCMQHLLVRVLFRSRPNAAVKFLDHTIDEITTSGHVPWIYAFRFLKVSISRTTAAGVPNHAQIRNLLAIRDIAERLGDVAISTFVAILEAIVQLQIRTPESNIEAGNALARARAYVNGNETAQTFHLLELFHIVDLAESLTANDVNSFNVKIDYMDRLRARLANDAVWHLNDTFTLPLVNSASTDIWTDAGGIFAKGKSSQYGLVVTWIRSSEAHLLGYLYKAASEYFKNRGDGKALTEHVQNGMKYAQDCRTIQMSEQTSLDAHFSRAILVEKVECQLLAIKAFASFALPDFDETRSSLQTLKDHTILLPSEEAEQFEPVSLYLAAMLDQSQGNFNAAVEGYSEAIKRCSSSQTGPAYQFHTSLRILSCLNSLLIAHSSQQNEALMTERLNWLKGIFEPITSTSFNLIASNPHFQSAYNLIRATRSPDSGLHAGLVSDHNPVIRPTKIRLQECLAVAKKVGNWQIITMATCFMNATFFAGIIGERALEAAEMARECAKHVRSPIWKARAAGTLAIALERAGVTDKAKERRKEAEFFLKRIPKPLEPGTS